MDNMCVIMYNNIYCSVILNRLIFNQTFTVYCFNAKYDNTIVCKFRENDYYFKPNKSE